MSVIARSFFLTTNHQDLVAIVGAAPYCSKRLFAIGDNLGRHVPTSTRPQGARRRLSTGELFAIGGSETSFTITESKHELVVAGLTVALVSSEFSKLSPMRSTSAIGMPVVETLAGVASQQPSGLLALESSDGSWGAAFDISSGRIAAAQSVGELGQLEQWGAAVHHRLANRFGRSAGTPLWVELAHEFVWITALESLGRAAAVGTQMTFIRGEVDWIGSRLPPARAVKLSHVLLEHARQVDDLPSLERRVGPETTLVIPLRRPTEPLVLPRKAQSGDDWAALGNDSEEELAGWRDACAIWEICDRESTVADIVDRSMLGRFRAMRALAILMNGGFVEGGPTRAIGSRTSAARGAAPVEYPGQAAKPAAVDFSGTHLDERVLAALAAHPELAQQTIEEFIGAFPNWLVELDAALTDDKQEDVRRVCQLIRTAADAVGGSMMVSYADLMLRLVKDGHRNIARALIGDLEAEYGELFRALMAFHSRM